MKLFKIFSLFIWAVLVPGYALDAMAESAAPREDLALPVVPDGLRTPAERADYVMRHFWDAMEWGDTVATGDEAWMEQTFVNFASLIPYASSQSAVDDAVAALFDAAKSDMTAYKRVLNLADRYLYEPESPMFNERAYIGVLNAVIADDCLDEVLLTRYRYQLEEAMKNMPGAAAADFPLVLIDGRESTLYDLIKDVDESLVMFYDPECDHCIEVIETIAASDSVKSRVDNGKLKIVAVYFEGESEALPAVKEMIPEWWISAYTPGNTIEENELYAIRRLPTLYLVGGDGIVIGKDLNPEALLK